MFERVKHRFRLAAGAERQARGDQRVLDLEFADQRQTQRMAATAMFQHEFLREPVDRGADQANALAQAIAVTANCNEPQSAFARRIDHGLRIAMVGRNHGGPTSRHEIAKQPQLGGEVMRDVGMIVHVIARQIGKAAGRNADAVEPKLVEAMRRGFERQMGDAVLRDLIELAMQRDRIGRRQRSINGSVGRYQSDRADAGGGMTETQPDLPRKCRNGGLAAGAGDGRDGAGLPRIELRRGERQRTARI